MTIDVDSVATDADLANWTGGMERLQGLLPEDWHATTSVSVKWARPARQEALNIALMALKKRRPPIRDIDMLDVTELKMVVVFGALEIVYGGAVEHEDSPNHARAKSFGQKFLAELAAMQPSVRAGASASSMTIRVSRG